MRQPVLAPGRRVVDALGVAGLVDLVQAVAGPDAGPDPILVARLDFRDDVRVSDVGAGHPDKVEQPVADGVAGGGDIVYPAGVHHRHAHRSLDLACEFQVRRDGGAHRRDDAGECLVAGHPSPDHADEVDALGDDPIRDRQRLVAAQPSGGVLVERHPNADDEVRACGLAHRANHPQREAQPVLEAAAVLVVAVVGQRGPERVQQMRVGLELDAVEAGFPAPGGGVGIGPHDAVHVPFLGHLREGAVRGLADRGREHHRQPVPVVVARATAQVGDLAHHPGTVLVHVVGQFAQPRHDLVLVDVQVAEGGRAVRRDHR